MKFILSAIDVNEAVAKMGRLLSSKSIIPILAGVLVEATEDCLMLTASDGMESIIHRLMIDEVDGNAILTPGKCVFSKETFDIAKKLKGPITFEVVDTNVIVTQNKLSLEFTTMDANDYPKVNVESNSAPFVLSGPSFMEMVTLTTFAASKNDVRPILTAVNMTFNKDKSVIVATDSHRLSRVFIDGIKSENDEVSLSVPATILDQALKSFDLTKDVIILPSQNSIAFANGNTVLNSRLLEGNYPDTSRLIPTDFNTDLVVNRKELIDGLELLQAISSNSTINLKVDSMFVELSAKGTGTKGTKEIVFESYDGLEDFSISFSPLYLLDALKRITDTSVLLRFNGPMQPFVAVSTDSESKATQLILPVRQS